MTAARKRKPPTPKPQPSPSKAQAPAKRQDWSAGDRIGKLSRSQIRELGLRAQLYGEVDPQVFMDVLDTLEEILSRVQAMRDEPHMVVEEIPDALAEIKDAADEELREAKESLEEARAELKSEEDRRVEGEADHAADKHALRKRAEQAEQAEHALETLSRASVMVEELDADLAETAREVMEGKTRSYVEAAQRFAAAWVKSRSGKPTVPTTEWERT